MTTVASESALRFYRRCWNSSLCSAASYDSDSPQAKYGSGPIHVGRRFHAEDLGVRHGYIKPRFPKLNGKVERSHRTDDTEFYQLLSNTDDVDLNKKLKVWEDFYSLHRPYGALNGKTPYEVPRDRLTGGQNVSSEV